MTKTRINITIDAGILARLQEKNLNISGMCENFLSEMLLTFENQIDPLKCNHKWTWAFSTPYGLAKECVKCGTIKKVKVENYEETVASYTK